MKVIVTHPVTEQQKKDFQVAAPNAELLFLSVDDVSEELLAEASVVIGTIPPSRFHAYEKLQLLQLGNAGTDGYTDPGVLAPHTILANSSGAYGLAISEHMLAQLLMMIKRLNSYYDMQKDKNWCDLGPVRGIYDSTTLVVGMGDIGGEFARRMHLLGSHVLGIRRHTGEKPDWLDALGTMAQLDEWLPKADYVACVLPGTQETWHLFDAERLKKLKPDAILINAGRGSAIDSYALNNALRAGTIGGACLDVVEPEPLPADHPLWEAPNLLLTPHISGFYHLHETLDRILAIALENLRALVNGDPIRNVVDKTSGYRDNSGNNPISFS